MNNIVKAKSLNLKMDKTNLIPFSNLCKSDDCKNKKEWWDYCFECALEIMKDDKKCKGGCVPSHCPDHRYKDTYDPDML